MSDPCQMTAKIEHLIVSVEKHIESSKESSNLIKEMLTKHEHVLYGNGEPGLKTKVALLEKESEKREKYHFAAGSALLASIGSLLLGSWEFFRR